MVVNVIFIMAARAIYKKVYYATKTGVIVAFINTSNLSVSFLVDVTELL